MRNIRFYIAIIILLFPVISYSEGRIITVNECVEIALQNHPDLQISEEIWKKAVADYKAVKAQNLLLIGAQVKTQEYTKGTTDDSDTSIAGRDTNIGIRLGLTAKYSLFDYTKIKQTEAARAALDLVKIKQMGIKMDISSNVKTAYYQFLLARENTILYKRLLDNNKTKFELTQKLFKSGQRPILDVSKAEVSNAQSILEYEKANNRYRAARIQLYMAMGIKDMGEEIVPVELDVLPELKYTYEELIKLAEIYNTDLRTIQITRDVDKIKISMERAQRYPTIDLTVVFGYENQNLYRNDSFKTFFDQESWKMKIGPSITITLPIYSGGAISAKVDSAISSYNKDIYQERQTQIMLENTILYDIKTLEELQKQIHMSELIIENAKKSLQLANKSYESGTSSLLDVQDAQSKVISAEISFLNSKYDYLNTIAQLSNKIGLEEEYLCRKK